MDFQAESTLVEFIHYNNWANAQLMAVLQQLNEEQLAATNPGAYGSVHRTLGHMVAAEADYVARLNGQKFEWGGQTSLSDLAAILQQAGADMLAVVQRLAPTSNVHEAEGNLTMDYHARVLFIQVVLHGVEHRTNITTILSGLGVATPEIDAWGYMWAHREKFAVKEGTL